MELWDDEGFGRVANTIGTPLFVDNLIESMARTSYARVCVEIDTKCTYPDHATVVLDDKRTFKIPFKYNWKPQRCTRCDVFGHSEGNCPKRKLENKKKNWDKVWVQIGAIIVEEDDHVRGHEKQKEGGSLTGSNDETMEPRDTKGEDSANEKHTEIKEDKWETPNKRHTTRATTTAECREIGQSVVQGKVQEVLQIKTPNMLGKIVSEYEKGKAIATQGQQQQQVGDNGKDGFMKDARSSGTLSKDTLGKGSAKGNASQHTQQFRRGT
ncbi:hypothetical protein FRX31_018855 [Thalictrum thalictroides]|uniref:Zinc knuckle (CCHC-type) family protein n=1 Tax=Thalictrum thalictroides TaxID=46969 RepID=A0A7J6W438_THATH|nr:hypothetical protein FRX31_018855 [Thalictrum thalictroides]